MTAGVHASDACNAATKFWEESMSAGLTRLFLAGVWCVASAAAWAHEDATGEAIPILDCDHPPEHAVNAVPEPFHWAQLECTPAGQMLVPAEDWVWRYPGSFTDRPFLPAWMSAEPGVSGEPRYFKSMAARLAGTDEAERLQRRFAQSMIALPASAGEQRIYVLTAESNLGEKFDVNFVYRSDLDIWAVPCVPDCRPEQLFHIYRRE
jgi:hypothetical protein